MVKRLLNYVLATAMALAMLVPQVASAQSGSVGDTYSGEELVATGSAFFGSVAQGLASVVERAVSQFGLPNAYVLGEEAGGAIFAGAQEVEIDHNGAVYRLRQTSLGKLILTK